MNGRFDSKQELIDALERHREPVRIIEDLRRSNPNLWTDARPEGERRSDAAKEIDHE